MHSSSLVLGDLNGDGHLDMVRSGITADNTGNLSSLLGNGDGTFQAPVMNTNNTLGAFDNDGDLDLASANIGQSNPGVSVLIGNGNGTFTSPTLYSSGSNWNGLGYMYEIATADFDGDGNLDLVSAGRSNSSTGNIGVLMGNGDGTFDPAATYSSGTAWLHGADAQAVAVGGSER